MIKLKGRQDKNTEFIEGFINSKIFQLAYKQLQKDYSLDLKDVPLDEFLESRLVYTYWDILIDYMVKIRDFLLKREQAKRRALKRWKRR